MILDSLTDLIKIQIHGAAIVYQHRRLARQHIVRVELLDGEVVHVRCPWAVYTHVRLRLQRQAIDLLAPPSTRPTAPTNHPPQPSSADVAVTVAVKR